MSTIIVEQVTEWLNDPFTSDYDKGVIKALFQEEEDPFEQIQAIAWTVGLTKDEETVLKNVLNLDGPLCEPENLADLQKVEWLEENFHRFTVEDFESKMG
jgi:hypothetical protein